MPLTLTAPTKVASDGNMSLPNLTKVYYLNAMSWLNSFGSTSAFAPFNRYTSIGVVDDNVNSNVSPNISSCAKLKNSH